MEAMSCWPSAGEDEVVELKMRWMVAEMHQVRLGEACVVVESLQQLT